MFRPRWFRWLGRDARCAPLRVVRSAGAHRASNCGTGGHTGRPYGSATGLSQGRLSAARTQGPRLYAKGDHSVRRGRCPHRPASPRPAGQHVRPMDGRALAEFCRRGGLYGRPEPGAICSGPGGSGGWEGTRDARPYGWCVRRGRIGHRTAARAAIQAAPTVWLRAPGGTDRGKINICTGKSFLDIPFLEMYNNPAMCKKLLPTGGYHERKEVRKVRKHCEQTRN